MPIIYRPARETDLVRADELVVGSINDLTERHGFGKIASPRPPPFQLFCLKQDPDGLWVAEDNGQMVDCTSCHSMLVIGMKEHQSVSDPSCAQCHPNMEQKEKGT